MSEDLQPLVEIEFEVLLCGAPNESTTPATAATMSYWLADRTTRCKEEEIDVGIYLGDNAKVDVEVEVESFEGDVGAETAIFPFVAE